MIGRLSRKIGELGDRPESGADATADAKPESIWFWEHYDEAASLIRDFFASDGISLEGKAVADVGCGDGITDLGLIHKTKPASLVGFDVNLTDRDYLLRRAGEENAATELPEQLEFQRSEPTAIPAADASFDYVITWSAFEHIQNPVAVLREMRRIVRDDGVMLLQLWPFYHSERGSHLWDWFPEPFHHLTESDAEIDEKMRASDRHGEDWTRMMAREFGTLNRITLDELQRCVLAAGFDVSKFELYTNPVHVTPELARYPLSQLGISGVKLLASAR